MIGTSTADEHNPLPEGTATEAGNEPLTEEEALAYAKTLAFYESLKPILGNRISKHRAGRTPKLTDGQRRRRDKDAREALQLRKHVFMEQQKDARALLAALDD